MRGRVRFSPILVFSLCLLIYHDRGREVGFFVIAAGLHECGHLLALSVCGCRSWRLSLGIGGAVIETGTLPYAQEFICAAAGPMVNLLLMLVPNRLFFIINLLLLSYNLLPIAPLDGWRMLSAAVGLFAPQRQTVICDLAEIAAAVVLLIVGVWCVTRLPYGRRPLAFAVGILLRTCIFQPEGIDKARFVG